MPPRKEKPSKVQYRRLVRQHGIRFEGPVPPRDWPIECKPHFQVIRSIQIVRYEDYTANKQIPRVRRNDFRDRVRYLKNKAYDFLDDAMVSEDTWRELEPKILERFDNPVICRNCKHDLWKSDNEADLSDPQEQSKLEVKRHIRKMCNCRGRSATSKAEDSDDEYGDVFDFAKGHAITHKQGDNLQDFSISMKPDRVIGLRALSQISHNESYFPVTGKRILLPFLVVEAKREVDAPGFRAIQYQTAFPLRRLLIAQEEMYAQGQPCEPCLVWFLAYQGEQWRLSAGIRKDNKVRIYDLWQGSIQSRDGALQLLLIVDYIWSWARDVYRPTIRKIIANSIPSLRDLSPASTDRRRYSVSLSTTTSPTSSIRLTDWTQSNRTVRADGNCQPAIGDICGGSQYDRRQSAGVLADQSPHSLLQWGVGHEGAPSWTEIGSIRHADVIHFEFRCYMVDMADDASNQSCLQLCLQSPLINAEGLNRIAALWTTKPLQGRNLHLEATARATFVFQTYFDPLTWQIQRVLRCLLWPTDLAARTMQSMIDIADHEYSGFERAILSVQQIHGRDSVRCALRDMSSTLSSKFGGQGWEWLPLGELEHRICHLPESPMGQSPSGVSLQPLYQDNALVKVQKNTNIQRQLLDLGFEQDTRTGNSMLAIRPSSWSQSCPNFCLFVLIDIADNYKDHLYKLLEEARTMKNYYCVESFRFSRSDWRAIAAWRTSLSCED